LLFVLVAVTFLTFSATFVADTPDEIVGKLLQLEAGAPERRAEISDSMRFEDPLVVRYGKWLGDAVTGDLGYSYSAHEPVAERIATRLPRTLALVAYAQLLALLLAIPAGLLAAWRANTWLDRGLSGVGIGLLAVPNYVIAVALVYVFALKLGWFSAITTADLGVLDVRSYVLPALSLALGQVAIYMRVLRTDMIATLQEDFISMARSKGLSTRTVLLRHALRPSSLSLVTTIGISTAGAVGGTVIVEQIFGMPGMGTMLVEAIFRGDVLVVQGVVAVIAAAFVLINFLVDVTYSLLDPRIGRGRRIV
jgi:peptide/nickel transport system permease protein